MDNTELLPILKLAAIASLASLPLSYFVSWIYRKNYEKLFGSDNERKRVLK